MSATFQPTLAGQHAQDSHAAEWRECIKVNAAAGVVSTASRNMKKMSNMAPAI